MVSELSDKTDGLTDPEVRELIRIADGGVKERRAHWYTLWISINHYYELFEQLRAIETLGNSRNRLALDYVRRLSETDRLDSEYGPCVTKDSTTHPHAQGGLAVALREISYSDNSDSFVHTTDDCHPQYELAHNVLSQALKRLESVFE